MQLAGATKVHIGLRRDAQDGQAQRAGGERRGARGCSGLPKRWGRCGILAPFEMKKWKFFGIGEASQNFPSKGAVIFCFIVFLTAKKRSLVMILWAPRIFVTSR